MDSLVVKSGSEKVYQPLEGGLVLRQASREDRQKLIDFNTTMHNAVSGAEVGFLVDGLDNHFRVEDFLVVADSSERIVSTLCLMEAEWRLGQTIIRFGQPEFVGTLEEYRGRGLVRLQFEILHRWMKERGLAFGLIGGIDYYYRQFGYEYGVDVTRAGELTVAKHGSLVTMPEGVAVRPALESDVPVLERLSAERDAAFELTSLVADNGWRWAVQTHRLETVQTENWIAEKDGQPLGSARIGGKLENMYIGLFTGDETAAQALIARALARPGADKLRVAGNPDMAVSRYLAGLNPNPLRPEAWYIRINDPVLALQKIAPELERRVAKSDFSGLNREFELGCYRYNIGLVFQEGKLKVVEKRPGQQEPKIGVPPDLLPKLLLGYRELDELAYLYPDLTATSAEDWKLLKVLFPPVKSFTRFYL